VTHTLGATSAFYEFQMAIGPALRAMTERGLCVDDALRQERIAALYAEEQVVVASMQDIIADVWDGLQRPDLFWDERVCSACHNGKKKRLTCEACRGAGKFYSVRFNLDSPLQVADVLYRALGLPPRHSEGKETTDEEALQSLLALDDSGLVRAVLRFRKLATMREIYERLAPARDGRVRTVFNGAGTYTGRLASASAFYVPASTNLQNLPSQEAARDPLFRVRDCITPAPGCVLVYADLSQAEARVVAYLCDDDELIERWQNPAFNVHKWTAAAIFRRPESEIDKDGPLYFLGKKSRHAFNYGEGPNKFWRTVNADADITGFPITLAQAKECFHGYHRLHPRLDGVWWARVEDQLRRTGRITASHCGWSAPLYVRFDPETDDLHPDSLRAGIAWEPQHTVAHVTNDALRVLYAREGGAYRVLHQTHDGVIVETPRAGYEAVGAILKEEMERPITVNGRIFTIPAEVFVCQERWSEAKRI
jgi:DNA polymerase I